MNQDTYKESDFMANIALKHFIQSVIEFAKFLEPYHNFPEERVLKNMTERILKGREKENFEDVEITPLGKWKEMRMDVMASKLKDEILFIVQGK
jgi:hypothetical protein